MAEKANPASSDTGGTEMLHLFSAPLLWGRRSRVSFLARSKRFGLSLKCLVGFVQRKTKLTDFIR